MKRVQSDALEVVNKSLGLTGAGAPVTELLDGVLHQHLEVSPLVRRGRTQAATSGIYDAVMRAIAGSATTIDVTVDPYNVGTGVISPYPDPVPPQFDVWLLAATLRIRSGGGSIISELFIDPPATAQGFGIDNTGTAVVVSDPKPVAAWDAVVGGGSNNDFGTFNGDNVWQRIGMRLARNTNLYFIITTGAAATYDCQMLMGIFPIALGQDVLI